MAGRRTAARRASSRAAGGHDPYHHGSLREALVKAAGEILQERGLAELTLRECARRAGVSHGAPAHHFGDVTGLLTEVAASGFESLSALMSQREAGAGAGPMHRLRAVGVAYIEFAAANRALFQLMFRSDRIDTGAERLRAAASATFGVLQGSLNAAQKGGTKEKSGEADQARALLAWSVVHGFATLLLEGQLARFQGERSARRFAQDMGERILSHMRAVFAN